MKKNLILLLFLVTSALTGAEIKNTVVVTGGHDQSCSVLGAGGVESGIAIY